MTTTTTLIPGVLDRASLDAKREAFDRSRERVRAYQAQVIELTNDLGRAKMEPITVEEYDRLLMLRRPQSIYGPTHGTIHEPGKPQVLSAVDIIKASREAGERARMMHQVWVKE